jgi:hypothetical protein
MPPKQAFHLCAAGPKEENMSARFFLIVCCAVVSFSGAYAQTTFTFTEDFEDPDWFDGITWTKEGADHPEIAVLQFTDGDERLNYASIGSNSGGLLASMKTYGYYTGGDHGEVYLDFHMSVPAGNYTFEVTLDQLVYWAEWQPGTNPWGCGINFHIGDAATLEYTSQQPNQAPLGPWVSPEFLGYQNFRYAMFPTIWIGWSGTGPQDINAVWVPRSYTKTLDDVEELTTTGHVIFRMVMRNKWNISDNMAFALDNLEIKLNWDSTCHQPIVFDLDDDGDVDMTDFAGFQRCLTLAEGVEAEGDCLCFDVDGDRLIGQPELVAFMNCASGAGVPADPSCAD